MAKNRYIGEYPVIGIRPIIDGRRGPMKLRESLEDQVMAMAEAAKELFEENLYYSNGEHVKVVMADTSIGRVPESAACAEKFKREGVAVTLSVTPCWCYGAETMDMDPMTIKGVWGFNGTERPGAVYLASVLATHAQKGLPAFGIYGHEVQDRDQVTEIPDDVKEKLLRFGRAAVAAATMRGKSYLQIGSMCMGIGGSIIDQQFMEEYLGLRVESVDEVEILRRMEEGIYDHEAYEKALAWTKEHCKEGRDDNPEYVDFLGEKRRIKFTKEEKEKQWEFTIKMYCIIKDLIQGNQNLPAGFEEEKVGHNAIAAGFQGQRQWTDHWPNCDYPEAVLNSSFDFEGPKEPMVFATENDVLNGLGMLFMELLTNRAQIFADVRTYWSPEACERVTGQKPDGVAANGFIHLINSGATALDGSGACVDAKGNHVMKPFWEMNDADIKACLNATDWCRADYEYFRGGGYSSHFRCKAEMPVTMLRFNIVEGIGPVLQIAEGWTADLPDEIHNTIDKRTDPTWPTTWFCPRLTGQGAFTDVYSVMANWGANHGVTVYGHVGADLITLASMLRIPVTMHNVPAEKVYRPHAWASFGTQDQQAADYAACKQYGPLYR